MIESRGSRGYVPRMGVLLLAFVLGGCASTIRIRDLLAEPQKYDGRTVQIEGRVTRGAGILGVGAFQVDDGTGQIVVIARGSGVPAQDTRTRVKGTFESVFNWGGRAIAAILQGGQPRN